MKGQLTALSGNRWTYKLKKALWTIRLSSNGIGYICDDGSGKIVSHFGDSVDGCVESIDDGTLGSSPPVVSLSAWQGAQQRGAASIAPGNPGMLTPNDPVYCLFTIDMNGNMEYHQANPGPTGAPPSTETLDSLMQKAGLNAGGVYNIAVAFAALDPTQTLAQKRIAYWKKVDLSQWQGGTTP